MTMGLLNWFRGTPEPELAEQPVREAAGAVVDPREETGFRRLTGGIDRDVKGLSPERMHRVAVGLWEGTPLGHWLVEMPLAFLLAEGVALSVEDEEAQAWLNAFWRDPITNMPGTLAKRARELALFGEQVWPAFVGLDGHVRLGYLDPSLIEDVVMDPDNASQPIGIITKPDADGRKSRWRVIVDGDDWELFSERTAALRESFSDGECFFFRVGDLMSGRRGRSDLMASADWVDALDQFLFGELERSDYMRAWIWDVTIQGATQEEVEKRAANISPPRSAGVRVHNEAEQWETKSPDIRAEDADRAARLFRNHAIGSLGLPEHWYGGGGDVNRASAAEMGQPAYKMLTMRQQDLKRMLEEVARYVIRRRLDVSGLPAMAAEPEFQPVAEFPELVSEDVSRYATALAQSVSAVAAAVDEGLMTRRDAVRLVAMLAGRLGVEIDAEATLEEAEAERRRRQDEAGVPPLADDPPEDEGPADGGR
jgi:hypothetical protein